MTVCLSPYHLTGVLYQARHPSWAQLLNWIHLYWYVSWRTAGPPHLCVNLHLRQTAVTLTSLLLVTSVIIAIWAEDLSPRVLLPSLPLLSDSAEAGALQSWNVYSRDCRMKLDFCQKTRIISSFFSHVCNFILFFSSNSVDSHVGTVSELLFFFSLKFCLKSCAQIKPHCLFILYWAFLCKHTECNNKCQGVREINLL